MYVALVRSRPPSLSRCYRLLLIISAWCDRQGAACAFCESGGCIRSGSTCPAVPSRAFLSVEAYINNLELSCYACPEPTRFRVITAGACTEHRYPQLGSTQTQSCHQTATSTSPRKQCTRLSSRSVRTPSTTSTPQRHLGACPSSFPKQHSPVFWLQWCTSMHPGSRYSSSRHAEITRASRSACHGASQSRSDACACVQASLLLARQGQFLSIFQ